MTHFPAPVPLTDLSKKAKRQAAARKGRETKRRKQEHLKEKRLAAEKPAEKPGGGEAGPSAITAQAIGGASMLRSSTTIWI